MKITLIGLCLAISLFASIESEVDKSRFSHKNGVLTDSFTGMQWQDNSDAKTIKIKWQNAMDNCSNLTLGRKSDWRLPNVEELKYIFEIKNQFKYLSINYYWSSSQDGSNGSKAWLGLVFVVLEANNIAL